jgi:hypothetical protein
MKLRWALACCLVVVVGTMAAPEAQEQRPLGPLVDVEPDSAGAYRLNLTGNYYITLRIQNNCDWGQDVITEDSNHRDQPRTRHVPAHSTGEFNFYMTPEGFRAGGDAFWVIAEHEESVSQGKKCLKARLHQQVALFWIEEASAVIPHGKLTADPLLVLNQEGGGGPTTTEVTPTAPIDPPAVGVDLEFPTLPIPRDTGPVVDENDLFGGASCTDGSCADLANCTGGACGGPPLIADPAFEPDIQDIFGFSAPVVINGKVTAHTPQMVQQPMNPLGLLSRTVSEFVAWWMPTLHAAEEVPLTLEQASRVPGGLHFLIQSQGGSTGKNLTMQVLNLTGKTVKMGGAVALEPLKKDAQQAATKAFATLAGKVVPQSVGLSGYCLEFLKLPPAAGQLLRVAGPEVQERAAPMKRILMAANRLSAQNKLRPDSNPESYGDSIRQWAIWTSEQQFNEKKFGEAFLGHTRKNVEGAGQKWTKQLEEVVKQRTPNRWQDIVAILRDAKAPIPQ